MIVTERQFEHRYRILREELVRQMSSLQGRFFDYFFHTGVAPVVRSIASARCTLRLHIDLGRPITPNSATDRLRHLMNDLVESVDAGTIRMEVRMSNWSRVLGREFVSVVNVTAVDADGDEDHQADTLDQRASSYANAGYRWLVARITRREDAVFDIHTVVFRAEASGLNDHALLFEGLRMKARVTETLDVSVETNSMAGPLALTLPGQMRFMQPHQLANASAVAYVEHNQLGVLHRCGVRMIEDRVFRFDLYPWGAVSMPRDPRAWIHPMLRSLTCIMDNVGMGKTISAIGAMLVSGCRGENPFGLPLNQRGSSFEMSPDMPRVNWADLARLHMRTKSRNAPDGGTMVIVPTNMISHWRSEISKVWRAFYGDTQSSLRVGVVGCGELGTGKTVSPRQLASNYDVVLVPMTLISRTPDVNDMDYIGERLDTTSPQIPLDPAQTFAFYGKFVATDGTLSEPRTVVISGKLLIEKLGTDAPATLPWSIPILEKEMHSSHCLVMDNETRRRQMCIANAFLYDSETRAGLFKASATIEMSDGRGRRSLLWGSTLGAPMYHPLAHNVNVDAPMSPACAAAYVQWYRLIVDEFHMLGTRNTKRFRYFSRLEYRSHVLLSAERRLVRDMLSGLFSSFIEFTGHSPAFHIQIAHEFTRRGCIHNVDLAGRVRTQIDLSNPVECATPAEVAEYMAPLEAVHTQHMNHGNRYAYAMFVRTVYRQASVGDLMPPVEARDTLIGLLERGDADARLTVEPPVSRRRARVEIMADTFLDANETATRDATTLQCPICFDETDVTEVPDNAWLAITPCRHVMCCECFTDIQSHQGAFSGKTCPMCRGINRGMVRIRGVAPTAETASGTEPATEAVADVAAAADAGGSGVSSGGMDVSQKVQALLESLATIVRERGEGAVVFCDLTDRQMRAVMTAVESQFSGQALVRGIFTSFNDRRRQKVLGEMMDTEACALPRILLARYRTCATGLNMIFANNVIFFNMPHRPELLHQAVGRVNRMGQTKGLIHVVPLLMGSLERRQWEAWRGMLQQWHDVSQVRQARSLAYIASL